MKKLINLPSNYVDESLGGLCAAFPGYARTGATRRVMMSTPAPGGNPTRTRTGFAG